MKLEIGKLAPGFKVEAIGGKYTEATEVKLGNLRGERVVLVFYPKDDTPGCTTQGCAMRDDWGQLEGKAQVFGVSVDTIASHEKFIKKYELPYALLADVEKFLVNDYGVWVEKKNFGKTYMGIQRTTVVIDAEGKVEAILEKVKPAEHLTQLLEILG